MESCRLWRQQLQPLQPLQPLQLARQLLAQPWGWG